MAFHNNKFCVANTGALVRFDYARGQTQGGTPLVLAMYPGGGQHPARSLVLDTVAGKMYVGIGSTANVNIEDDPRYATKRQFKLDGTGGTTFAAGIRVPQGLAINYAAAGGPKLWSCVNERDDLVPDYAKAVSANSYYGWPHNYLTPQNIDPGIGMAGPRTAETKTP